MLNFAHRNWVRTVGVAAVVAAGIFASAAQAQTPPPCLPVQQALEAFKTTHGELPLILGIANSGQTMMLLANPDTRGWTILRVTPEGQACGWVAGTDLMAPLYDMEPAPTREASG